MFLCPIVEIVLERVIGLLVSVCITIFSSQFGCIKIYCGLIPTWFVWLEAFPSVGGFSGSSLEQPLSKQTRINTRIN